jgi:hypothetical protein
MKTIPAFQFDRDEMIAIPNFLPDDVARALASEFPGVRDINWHLEGPGHSSHSADPNIEKITSSHEPYFPPLIRHVMHEFNSGVMLDFVSRLTGYQGLIPDPWFGGCGLHSTGRGGRLMVHADASRHPNENLHQILNLIYYVTPGWQEAWGGGLEMWCRDAKTMVKKVVPEFNTMLLFYTGSKSYHGHPHPITSPEGIRRNSMAVYYYTTDREVDDEYTGYNRSVSWVRTNDYDRKMPLSRRLKEAARAYLPGPIVRGLEAGAGLLRR